MVYFEYLKYEIEGLSQILVKKFTIDISFVQVISVKFTACEIRNLFNFLICKYEYELKNSISNQKYFFVRRTSKVILVCVALRAKSWFSRTSTVKFWVCGKSTFRTQNGTESANFWYKANKNIVLY